MCFRKFFQNQVPKDSESAYKTKGDTQMVYQAIKALVQYGLNKGLLTEDDAIYARNQLLEALKMDEYEEPENDGEFTGDDGENLEKILKVLLDYAAEKGLFLS